MAGMPGRSGGKRAGAGRKPKPKQDAPVIEAVDMLDMLQKVALGLTEATPLQVRAAIAAVQYTHAKKGEGGKKEQQEKAAKQAGAGRFAPGAPPRLAVVNGKKVAGAT